MKIILLLTSTLFSMITFAAVPASIDVNKISEEVYILSGKEYGTNIGAIWTNKGIVLIDPMPGKDEALLNDLEKAIADIYKKAPIFMVNTHGHEDHMGGNEYFKKNGAKLYRAELDDIGIKHIVVKSHSSEDNIYYHKSSNSIFVGDVFDTSWHPTFYFGGTKGFVDAIDEILKLGDKKSLIVPGHGKPSSKVELSRFKENTLEWVSRVKELLLKQKTVEEIMEDHKANKILQRFNVSNRPNFLPKKSVIRFIERTITVIKKEQLL